MKHVVGARVVTDDGFRGVIVGINGRVAFIDAVKNGREFHLARAIDKLEDDYSDVPTLSGPAL